MGVITKWAQELRDRRARRRADAGARALKRKAAKAQRLQHERLDDKLPR
jgi:hypothetical protein